MSNEQRQETVEGIQDINEFLYEDDIDREEFREDENIDRLTTNKNYKTNEKNNIEAVSPDTSICDDEHEEELKAEFKKKLEQESKEIYKEEDVKKILEKYSFSDIAIEAFRKQPEDAIESEVRYLTNKLKLQQKYKTGLEEINKMKELKKKIIMPNKMQIRELMKKTKIRKMK